MAKLTIAPSASAELDSIIDYINLELHNPEAADALLDEIDKCYDTIENLPSSFPFCPEPRLRAAQYHRIEVRGYVMIYRYDEDVDEVRVLHFYHDTQSYLTRMTMELI